MKKNQEKAEGAQGNSQGRRPVPTKIDNPVLLNTLHPFWCRFI